MAVPEVMLVTGRAGETIALPISQPPATGYAWMLELPEGVRRVDDAPGSPPPPGRALGAAAGGALQVQAAAGTHRIHAVLARPWNRDNPVSSVVIDLVID